LRGAAEAILERTKLCPNDPDQQARSAEDFETLATQVTARGHGQLSREDQIERDHYREESKWMCEASKAVIRQSDHNLTVETIIDTLTRSPTPEHAGHRQQCVHR